MVPTESIIPILKGQKVYLYKNGKAKEQKVGNGGKNFYPDRNHQGT